MAFQPSMTTRLEGISVIDDLRWRAWDGVIADVWHARSAAGARGEYVSKHPRIFIMLEKEGGDIDLKFSPTGPDVPAHRGPQHLSFVPSEVPLWSRTEEAMRIRHLDLHFDVEALSERVGQKLDPARLAAPRLMFVDDGLLGLARLIAEECIGPHLRHDLYGDALTLAFTIDLLQLGRTKPRKQPTLAAWQIRRATAFIEDNCLRNIRLQELAELTQLSQSYFSYAFKAATGLPPSQWHMKARIRKVQDLLAKGDLSLSEIAAISGFADQSHFTRVFRRVVGATPAAWRGAHRS